MQQPAWLKMKFKSMSTFDVLLHFGIRNPPIDVFRIARDMEVEVIHVEDPGYDGAIKSSWERAVIWLDSQKSLEKQRFALAHLMGHLVLHTIGATYYAVATDSLYGMSDARLKCTNGSVSSNDIAKAVLGRQASDFGAALLMPRFLLQPMMYHTFLSVEEIAEVFCVSIVGLGGRLDHIRKGKDDR